MNGGINPTASSVIPCAHRFRKHPMPQVSSLFPTCPMDAISYLHNKFSPGLPSCYFGSDFLPGLGEGLTSEPSKTQSHLSSLLKTNKDTATEQPLNLRSTVRPCRAPTEGRNWAYSLGCPTNLKQFSLSALWIWKRYLTLQRTWASSSDIDDDTSLASPGLL